MENAAEETSHRPDFKIVKAIVNRSITENESFQDRLR